MLMKPNAKFSKMDKSFWAAIRTISQEVGYTIRGKKLIKVPTVEKIVDAFDKLSLDKKKIIDQNGSPTIITKELIEYFEYRANILNDYVEPRLMDAKRASECFRKMHKKYSPSCPLPMNKQKGEKKAHAYFTCIINMIVESIIGGRKCDYDPRELTTVTTDGFPLRTLARRVDGAFPSAVNPIAIWEIKEYYYTTTFGSRVADGVYETLLDGMEIEELHEHEKINVLHYLMIDAHYTWWDCGRSYLCRIIDMLHMGYVDEVLFGYEVVERLPDIVTEWVDLLDISAT